MNPFWGTSGLSVPLERACSSPSGQQRATSHQTKWTSCETLFNTQTVCGQQTQQRISWGWPASDHVYTHTHTHTNTHTHTHTHTHTCSQSCKHLSFPKRPYTLYSIVIHWHVLTWAVTIHTLPHTHTHTHTLTHTLTHTHGQNTNPPQNRNTLT